MLEKRERNASKCLLRKRRSVAILTMMTEYIYWPVRSNFGMHDAGAGCKKAKSEWCPDTKEKLKAQDLTIYNLINDPKYAFLSVLPNASYSYYTFNKSDIKAC